ncbi:hypothetical protein ACFJXH_12175 [Enterococcus faecalis]|uniref:hypothetical protein n=1 Tax=Enterococcus faecalis TaxID=1351 RepID=UPI000CF32607|nr:hypothetical protein [Enterococcus faecalis]PQG40245.1 hypothetical protein CUS34_02670 [Enterococcus faecalis]
MSELTKLQKISALSKDLMNKKMNDTDRFVHLSHIHELAEELQPQLNPNQQIVLDWLKTPPLFPISAVYLLEAGKNVPENVKKAYENFDKKEEAEVLQAFSQWSLEQEE